MLTLQFGYLNSKESQKRIIGFKILQIPILYCFRHKGKFTPKIDVENEIVIIPSACPKRNCRSKTWNIPNNELEIIKEKQYNNLNFGKGGYSSHLTTKTQKVEVLDKYKPKTKKQKNTVVCQICEIFYDDNSSLERHQKRRHTGLCHKCKSSNVLVQIVKGITICKNCFERK